jgi:hypothetical protein
MELMRLWFESQRGGGIQYVEVLVLPPCRPRGRLPLSIGWPADLTWYKLLTDWGNIIGGVFALLAGAALYVILIREGDNEANIKYGDEARVENWFATLVEDAITKFAGVELSPV